MTDTAPPDLSRPDATPGAAQPPSPGPRKARAPRGGRSAPGVRPAHRSHPVLDQLGTLYPALFGATPRPLKRGIFEDLLAAHPDAFRREDLKLALGLHTRSTRYLQAVAEGQRRHDLSGQPVEAMAPEHVHHALLEVYRRRAARSTEDLRPRLVQRIVHHFELTGLDREAYTERVRSRDEAANAILEEAMQEAASRAARAEALLRAFEASGQTLEAFADMYGMEPRQAGALLERARRLRPPAA